MDSPSLCSAAHVGVVLLWVTSLLFKLGLAAVSEGWQLVVGLGIPVWRKEEGA